MAELAILGVVALLVVLLVVRPVLNRLMEGMGADSAEAPQQGLLTAQTQAALSPPSVSGALPSPAMAQQEEAMIDIDQIEGRVKASSVKQVGEIIERHPEETVGIVRQWMYQNS